MIHNNYMKLLMQDKLIYLNRLSKTVKGGRIFSFGALTIIGNYHGQVGYGYGKAKEISVAINKSLIKAKKNIITLVLNNRTLPYPIKSHATCSYVIMLPAVEGTGIIAGKVMRAILELAGIANVRTKIYGSTTPINVVRATMKGLANLKSAQYIAAKRNKTLNDLL